MNAQALRQTAEQLYPEIFFSSHDRLVTDGLIESKLETIKGLRSIITLSLQCLEKMLKDGYAGETSNRDSMIQDNDPYMEHLVSMVRKGKNQKVQRI